jgi:hypothetical protein
MHTYQGLNRARYTNTTGQVATHTHSIVALEIETGLEQQWVLGNIGTHAKIGGITGEKIVRTAHV